jgi:hypothetical protein
MEPVPALGSMAQPLTLIFPVLPAAEALSKLPKGFT